MSSSSLFGKQSVDFEEAVNRCNSETLGSNLASLSNSKFLDFASAFLEVNQLNETGIYIGLSRPSLKNLDDDEAQDLRNPALITFLDSNRFDDSDPLFGLVRSQDPWAPNEPEGTAVDHQPCVLMVNGQWRDVACNFKASFGLCKRECTEDVVLMANDDFDLLIPLVDSGQGLVTLLLITTVYVHNRQLKEYNRKFGRNGKYSGF